MSRWDAVTVVVPTRNRRAELELCVDAVLGQREVEVELIVVDEGSSDDTPRYLGELAGDDARVQVVRHEDPKGVAGARNAGIARASAPWVSCCDDDDLWAPDRLRSQLEALRAQPDARWSCTGSVSVTPDMEVVGHDAPPPSGDVSERLRAFNCIPAGGSGILADTGLAREVGGYDAWFTGCEDYEFAVKLSLQSPVAAVDRPLVAYRLTSGSMSSNVATMHQGQRRVVERWRGSLDPQLARRGDELADEYLGQLLLRGGHRLAVSRHYVSMALRHRRPRLIATSVIALANLDALRSRYARRSAAAVPPAWRDEVAAWIPGSPETAGARARPAG